MIYSITASARASSVVGMSMPKRLGGLHVQEHLNFRDLLYRQLGSALPKRPRGCDLRNHSAQAVEDRRAGTHVGAADQVCHGLGLSGRRDLGARAAIQLAVVAKARALLA
jgi:hypothetical protein